MNFKKIFSFLLALTATFTVFSQGGANSIYSQYGLGFNYPHQFSRSFSMGNTGIALTDNLTLNTYNPASIADIQFTTFEVNAIAQGFQSKDGVNSPSQFLDGSLGTIGLGTPLLKGWGAMLGLTPYSSTGYNSKALGNDLNAGNFTDYYKGFGGVNELFLASGYRYKNISIGAKVNYLFGNFNHQKLRVFDDVTYLSAYKDQQYQISSLTYDFGAQYKLKFSENSHLTFGAVYGLQQTLNSKYSIFSVNTVQTKITDPMESDAIVSIVENTTASPSVFALTLPAYFGGGLAFKYREKLTFALDYKQQDWTSFELNKGAYRTGRSINLGAEFLPNRNSVGKENYHKRIAYRLGLAYQNLPLVVNGTGINDYSLTLGAAFPLRKYKYEREVFGSVINVGVQLGTRGSLSNNLVKDEYIKLNLGFTLNDKWYIKRKFD